MEELLTPKEDAFCEFYVIAGCKKGVGAQAARDAGYPEKSAKAIASQLLKKPKIQKRIEEKIKEVASKVKMTADEAIQNIQDMANKRGKWAEASDTVSLNANINVCKIKGVKGLADKNVIEEEIPFDGLSLEELRALKKYLEEKNRFPRGTRLPDIRTVVGYLSERLPKESGTGDN